jgi:benzoyl-CoA 2,3-dioxygenase component B
LPALNALNMRLRDDFIADAAGGVHRWNRIIDVAGVPFSLRLPHVAFHRHIGEFASVHADPDGTLLDMATWQKRRDEFLPSATDGAFIESLMRPVREKGAFADWIAPPKTGIDGKPGDFEYVKLHD